MPRENNFLLGRGELLTTPVTVKGGGGAKNPPYSLGDARKRVGERLVTAEQEFKILPADARPKGEVVAALTMHPRYISKSDFPDDLLNAVGLRAIGSRMQRVQPEQWGIEKHPQEALTETYFVAGHVDAFENWSRNLERWRDGSAAADVLTQIEDLQAFRGRDKLKGIPVEGDEAIFEFVLHNAHDPQIVEAFYNYAERHQGEAVVDKRRDVRGLTFLPVRAPIAMVRELADFTFVRVARGMPTLRPLTPAIMRTVTGFKIDLPDVDALSPDTKTVVFDGGLPDPNPLARWVNYIEPPSIAAPIPDCVGHGLAVTSAFLFGSLTKGKDVPQPFSPVDHVRVLDTNSGRSDFEIIDVLDRINEHLKANTYDFVNLSLGPNLSVEDDEVTLWTSSLDEWLAKGTAVATVAAGNNGEDDAASGLNRIQVPADAVNALSVGAADSMGASWARAPYSAVGPGRSPGRAKPDLLAFGGSDHEPFMVIANTATPRATEEMGTSFAAPLALRTAVAVRAMLGKEMSALALRALMIHRADPSTHVMKDVGWGRSEADPITLITTDDDEAIIIYQGDLVVGQHLRAPVPLNGIPLSGKITLSATLVIAPEVDPEYPGAYTRSGLEVSFRPKDSKPGGTKAKPSPHPKPSPFFSDTKVFGGGEYESRKDGHKWEPTLRHYEEFKASALSNPVFDIYYHHRIAGAKAVDQQPIPYALVIGVKAPAIADLYNQVVRAYPSILTPLRPVTRIQLST